MRYVVLGSGSDVRVLAVSVEVELPPTVDKPSTGLNDCTSSSVEPDTQCNASHYTKSA